MTLAETATLFNVHKYLLNGQNMSNCQHASENQNKVLTVSFRALLPKVKCVCREV